MLRRAPLCTFVCVWAWALLTSAQDAPHNTYEESRVQVALDEAGLTREDVPAGKRIAFIKLVRHDVFVPEEPWPTWANWFHTMTQESVIEREYLFHVGETYDQALIDETERNLRGMVIFAIVRIIAVKTDNPNEIGLLVHTRDLWSLRTEWDLQATGLDFPRLLFAEFPQFVVRTLTMPWNAEGMSFDGAVVDRVLFQMTERNVAGYNKVVIARFQMNPITFSVGEVFQDRRLFLGTHRLDQTFDVIFNRESNEVEGTEGRVVLSQPFYNLAQNLSYKLDVSYSSKISRVLQTGRVALYDVPGTDESERIARLWDDDSIAVIGSGTRRFGERFKHAFTLGAGYRDRRVDANAQTGLAPEFEADFRRDVLPRVRREVFPSLSIEVFDASFETFRELATFGQSEPVRVGPYFRLDATLPLQFWGSSTDSVTLALNSGYVVAPFDALFELNIGGSARREREAWINQVLTLQARGATPPVFAGRLVFRGLWEARRRDTDNTAVWLGGDNGLRGFPSQALIGFGASRLLTSVEYRTKSLDWRSVHLGFVLFYDAGTVYERLEQARMHSAVGAGMRVLFPQFDRFVFRLDLGKPLTEPGVALLASFGGGQALPLTQVEDERIAATY